MTKLHPTAIEGSSDLAGRKGIKDYSNELIQRVGSDRDQMLDWLIRKVELYDKRFSRYGRNVTFPWPGACDFVMPLEDIHVEEFKPPMMALTFGSPRVFTMVPQNADGVPYALNCSTVMQSIHMGRGTHSMPDFQMQTAYSIESLGQHGLCVDKTYYAYETRQTVEAIRKIDMPSILANLAVAKDVTPEEAQQAQQIGVTLISKQQFDAQVKQIEAVVAKEYNLDPKDKIDRLALEQIVKFLRDGNKDSRIVVKRRAVLRDCPRTVNVPIEDIIVPQGTVSIETAERIAHRMFFSESDMRQRGRDEVWDDKAVEAVLNNGESKGFGGRSSSSEDLLWQARVARQQSGIGQVYGQSANGQFEVWECYDTWDIDGDGLDERVVLTLEPKTGAILKAIELPFDNGEWPFTSTFFEATDQSYFGSRGIPEKIADPAAHATALARAEQNGLTLQTSQTFTYLVDGGINPQTMPWMPGLMIPVNQHNALQPVQMTPTALALEGPMRAMMGLSERIVSGTNRALIDQPPPERRTKGEVDYIQHSEQKILSVRGMLWQIGLSRKGQLAWDLWKQYGPDEWYSYISGGTPQKFTQAQIRGQFVATPFGAVADMDPEYRKNQALMLLQLTQQVSQQYGDDPRFVVDPMQAFVNLLDEFSPVVAKTLVHRRSPEEVQQLVQGRQQQAQQMQAQQELAQKALMNFPLNPEEAMQTLAAIKAQMPWKELQAIIVEGQTAQRSVERDQALVGGPGGVQ